MNILQGTDSSGTRAVSVRPVPRLRAVLIAAALGCAALATQPAGAAGLLVGIPTEVRGIPVTPTPLPSPVPSCLVYSEERHVDGPVTFVSVKVRNACASSTDIAGRIDLVVFIIGSTHSWIVDSAKLQGGEPAVVEGSFTNGIVGQEACTRFVGTWRSTTSPVVAPHPLVDDRCR